MSTLDITRPECQNCKFADKKALAQNKPYCTFPGLPPIKNGICKKGSTQ